MDEKQVARELASAYRPAIARLSKWLRGDGQMTDYRGTENDLEIRRRCPNASGEIFRRECGRGWTKSG
jgi:hypothetical protein